MPIQNELGIFIRLMSPKRSSGAFLAAFLFAATTAFGQAPFREKLSHLPFKVAFETYTNSNWEIFVMNADGSNPVNLTQTPTQQEHYPQVSPDGSRICFSV